MGNDVDDRNVLLPNPTVVDVFGDDLHGDQTNLTVANDEGSTGHVLQRKVTPTPAQPLLPVPFDTPVKPGPSSVVPFATFTHYRHSTVHMMGEEMKGYIIPGYSPINYPKNAFAKTVGATMEGDAYVPFIQEMQPFAPALQLVDSHTHPDTKNCGVFSLQVKPDVCVYSDGFSEGCDSSMLDIFVKFKWDAAHDPFKEPFITDALPDVVWFIGIGDKVVDTLGQITAYASAQLGSQYQGAIVTDPIKYGTDKTLAEFFLHYSQAPPELHGIDTTVTAASEAEAQLAREQLKLTLATRMLKTSVLYTGNTPLLLIFPASVATGLPPVGHAT
ncbi:hypothetical protein HYDPIDRAFT_25744 [Hydnomerulius pinastri MD-312]|nr:hypothetical protein HYDPIDRAFT_25744 [Hydnomerulius pinastri MD-312]